MNELLREIEDDIKRERYEKLWHDFGKIMVGVSIIIILVTIGIVIAQNHKQSKAMGYTAEFIKGTDRMNIEDYKGAIEIFEHLAEDRNSTYYALAMLRKAQAQMALSDHEAAAKTYAELATRDTAFGQLASMSANVDAKNPLPESDKNSAFYFTQSEWRGWQLLQQGKKLEAVNQFLALYNDNDTPYSIHERMHTVLAYLDPEKLELNLTKASAHE